MWEVPDAIERGQTFSIKVGLKCSAECRPTGWTIEICDQAANACASATVGREPWPGTTALFYAVAELVAPDAEGLHAWKAFAPVVPADGQAAAHGAACAGFNIRVVPAPECRLTVVVVDKANQLPVEGAKVVAHPYRAFTDTRGVAELRVPKGAYRLFVSGRDCLPFRHDGEVTADAAIRAELESDRAPSDAEIWA